MDIEGRQINKSKAMELLKQLTKEIQHLRTLNYKNQEIKPWLTRVKSLLSLAFDDDDYQKFANAELRSDMRLMGDEVHQNNYQHNLTTRKTILQSILDKHEILGIEERPASEKFVTEEKPKAFIAHGGESPALRKLESYLEALGIQPLVVEEQPSGGRSIAENVDYYARQSDFAIILATKGDVDGKTGGFIPRGNVLMEIGKLQELLKDRIVYLVQAGTKLPTNISEKVRVRFSPQSMDDSFIKIAKELKKFGILKAVKPPKE